MSATLETLKDNEIVRTDIPPGELNTQALSAIDYDASVAPGAYVLKLVDATGTVYAQGGITIADVDIVNTLADWRDADSTSAYSATATR